MRPIAWTIAATLVAGALSFADVARAGEVDDLFLKGIAALETDRFEDARKAFEAVWRTRKTHDVAANLAQAEIQLGLHRDAAEHLDFARRNFPVSGKATVRKQIEDLLAEEKKHVATLRVTVSAEKADVRVNGKPAGAAPLDGEVFAEPGAVRVEASREGYETATQAVDVKAGESRDVSLTLAPKTAAPGPRKEILIAGGATAGAALIAGVALIGVGASTLSDAKTQRDDLIAAKGRRACETGTDPACKKIADGLSSAQTMTNAGASLCIGAGAVAAGTLLYMLLGRPKAEAPVQAGAMITPESGGAFVRGSF